MSAIFELKARITLAQTTVEVDITEQDIAETMPPVGERSLLCDLTGPRSALHHRYRDRFRPVRHQHQPL